MREIKFRGRHIISKKWIIGDLIHEEWIGGKAIMIKRKKTAHSVLEETVGQFTGLHDKNGKEIYEGDIVKINAHSYDFGFEKDRIGEIRFIEGCFGFYKQLSEKEYLFNELSTEFGYGELEHYEVIGNIYENPELLKGADNIE